MNTPIFRRRLSGLGSLFWLICSATLAQDADPATYGDEYQTGDFGRVRYQENGVTITRAELQAGGRTDEEAGLNAPIFPGDSITTESGQRVEVQLSSGSLVRLDEASEIVFLALPDPYAEIADNTVLQLAEGTLRLAVRLGDAEEFRIDTPACTIYLNGDADLRVEVDPRGRTTVFARRGPSEVVGEGGSVLLRSGMNTTVEPGEVPYDPEPFNTLLNDGFDRWVEDRDDAHQMRDRYAGDSGVYDRLPSEVRPYYGELSGHGDWIATNDYGYVWSPQQVDADWRPYSDGYWNYGPHGYFWVSYEPWGWAPYHYGRWTWLGVRGWCWVPGQVFAGAWVSWSWGPTYVGWSALDCWGLPAYRSTLHFGYYDPYAWTFVGYGHLHHHHYAPYRMKFDELHDVEHQAIVTRPPRVSPGTLASSVEARKQAVRELHENRRLHVPATAARTGRPSFREHETRLVAGAARARTAEAGRPATLDRRGVSPATSAPAGTIEHRQSRSRTVERGSSPEANGPRGVSTRRLTPRTDPAASDDPARTTDRVRSSIYRQMSVPRETRPRPKDPERSTDKPAPAEESRPRSEPPSPRKAPPKKKSSDGGGDQGRSRPVQEPPRAHASGGIVSSHPRAGVSRSAAPRPAPRRQEPGAGFIGRRPAPAPRPAPVPRAQAPSVTRQPQARSAPAPAPVPGPRTSASPEPRQPRSAQQPQQQRSGGTPKKSRDSRGRR